MNSMESSGRRQAITSVRRTIAQAALLLLLLLHRNQRHRPQGEPQNKPQPAPAARVSRPKPTRFAPSRSPTSSLKPHRRQPLRRSGFHPERRLFFPLSSPAGGFLLCSAKRRLRGIGGGGRIQEKVGGRGCRPNSKQIGGDSRSLRVPHADHPPFSIGPQPPARACLVSRATH